MDMTKRELLQLEKDLRGDLVDSDEAVMARVRDLVRKFLLHEAGKLAGTRVKDEAEILDLIQIHARVELLRKLIQNPTGFNQKDMKELFKSIGDAKGENALSKPTNPLSLIAGLDVSDDQKAKLTEATLEILKNNMRRELQGGTSEA